ncbi:MAG: hypothetical protein AVO38_11740 [delta proteobacterium ML8_D]|jgi:hypothetical protein|nr:MAG: hypothetical protein AVO38_11740 [delta proteobacterium ML8_D]
MQKFKTYKAFSESIRYIFGGANCAQAVLLATGRLIGLEDRQILKAATGLAGGIGHEGKICGALTGGIYLCDYFNRICFLYNSKICQTSSFRKQISDQAAF